MSESTEKRGVKFTLEVKDAYSPEYNNNRGITPTLDLSADIEVDRYTRREARDRYHWQEYLLENDRAPKLGAETSTWIRSGYYAWYPSLDSNSQDYVGSAEKDPITGILNTESTVGIRDRGHRVISTHFVGGASLFHEGVLRTDFEVELTNDKFSTSGVSILGARDDLHNVDLDQIEVGRVDATHRKGNVDGISVIRPDEETHGYITIEGQIETIWFEQGVDISRVLRNGGDPIVQLHGQTDLVFENMGVREVKNLVKPYM